jgi:iron-sulfur cluster repair protein YtfE (RIC family)
MLVRLTAPRADERDVVDLMLECHERIRSFSAMAVRLATTDADDREVGEAAAAIRRYFAEALPLHVADEDEDLVPLLAGHDPDVDAALAELSAEHLAHAPDVGRLVEICDEIARDPRRRAVRSAELAALADRISKAFAIHLEREERVVFPALRTRPEAERDALRAKVRARRAHALRDS